MVACELFLQFMLLGTLIWGGVEYRSTDHDRYIITLGAAESQRITENYSQQFGQMPTPQELQGLIDRYIREEIYWREGVAVPAYITLGIEHILTGIDHLGFLLGLILLVRSRMRLIATITAFTVAHSLTLAATALQVIAVRPAVIEALVALSIVFAAVELVHRCRGGQGFTVRYPWLIPFTFGLLHGAAFSDVLVQIGLPSNAIPLSLLLFNVGVELGQLLFIAVVLSIGWALTRLPRQVPAWARWVPPYAIGSCAAFWFLERLSGALS